MSDYIVCTKCKWLRKALETGTISEKYVHPNTLFPEVQINYTGLVCYNPICFKITKKHTIFDPFKGPNTLIEYSRIGGVPTLNTNGNCKFYKYDPFWFIWKPQMTVEKVKALVFVVGDDLDNCVKLFSDFKGLQI